MKTSKLAARCACLAIAAMSVIPMAGGFAPVVSTSLTAAAADASASTNFSLTPEMLFGKNGATKMEASQCVIVMVYQDGDIVSYNDGRSFKTCNIALKDRSTYHVVALEYVRGDANDTIGRHVLHYMHLTSAGLDEYYVGHLMDDDDFEFAFTPEMFPNECARPIERRKSYDESFADIDKPGFASSMPDFCDFFYESVDYPRTSMCPSNYDSQWLPGRLVVGDAIEFYEYRNAHSDESVGDLRTFVKNHHGSEQNYKAANIDGAVYAFDYNDLGIAYYGLFGNEWSYVGGVGERAKGSVRSKIMFPSNLTAGSEVHIKGIDWTGDEVEFSIYRKRITDDMELPVGMLRKADIYIRSIDSSVTLKDTVLNGKPSNGQYVETRPQFSGGDYVIKDNTGAVIKKGNILTDGWVVNTDKRDPSYFETLIDLYRAEKLDDMGFTNKEIESVISSGAIWLEFEVKPLAWLNREDMEHKDNVDCLYNRDILPDNTRLVKTVDRNYHPTDEYTTNLSDKLVSAVTGDANNDGEFGVSDVVQLQKWLLAADADIDDPVNFTVNADFTHDGVLDVFDLCLMKRLLVEGMNK